MSFFVLSSCCGRFEILSLLVCSLKHCIRAVLALIVLVLFSPTSRSAPVSDYTHLVQTSKLIAVELSGGLPMSTKKAKLLLTSCHRLELFIPIRPLRIQINLGLGVFLLRRRRQRRSTSLPLPRSSSMCPLNMIWCWRPPDPLPSFLHELDFYFW
jgi:hypothetical protein